MRSNYIKFKLVMLGMLLNLQALASIPVTPPSQGGQTDLIRAFASYGSDIGQLASYAIAVIGIISCAFVVNNAFKQADASNNMGLFLRTAGWGIFKVVGILFLVNMAVDILVAI